MPSENCFLLLGKTGVGKSTLSKILSDNQSIKIGDSLNSETKISIVMIVNLIILNLLL